MKARAKTTNDGKHQDKRKRINAKWGKTTMPRQKKKKNNLNKRTRRRVIPKVEITQSIPEEGRFFSPKKGEKQEWKQGRMLTLTHSFPDIFVLTDMLMAVDTLAY